jgi:hypothetical protein
MTRLIVRLANLRINIQSGCDVMGSKQANVLIRKAIFYSTGNRLTGLNN